uniref:Dymeclin n=1 Tax=Caenorhabditis tropicalis TaxID=1561998 RepID=A0A1I7UIT0_9PELO
MGSVITKETALQDNVYLRKLSGLEPVDDYDPFWNKLLSFSLKFDDDDEDTRAALESALDDHLQCLMYNTQTTGNFAAFIRLFLRRATELKTSEQCDNKIYLWQTSNALLILRYIARFLTQRMTEKEFVRIFAKNQESTVDGTSSSSSSSVEDDDEETDSKQKELKENNNQEVKKTPIAFQNTAEEFTYELVSILINISVNETTLPIHVEAVRCLLTLLSSQLYNESIVNTSIVFRFFIDGACAQHAAGLTKTLLLNYLIHNSEYHMTVQKPQESIVFGLASSMWSMVQMAAGLDASEEDQKPPLTLGNLSILLLLNLSCHQPLNASNPFKETLALFQNAQEVSTVPTQIVSFKIDYNGLYERLCATAGQEPPMLLLYMLLQANSGFRNYVLSRINLENLVVPVLRILHDGVATSNNSHHVYLALIVALILSEDDIFCKIIHETPIKDLGWLDSDFSVREISLGGLTALVFIRAIQKNALKTKDRYLHTNCLAALANMSAFFKNLAPVVCQRLISLLDLLTKRHAKMVDHMRVSSQNDVAGGQPINFHDDITALEEGIRTLLEIINSALCGGLRHNTHLIYNLLYHRSLFDAYVQHPMFQDLLVNIAAVISHFSSKVVNVPAGDGVTMLQIIEKEANVWPTDKLAKFPELKFRYVEDEYTVDFFVPYVWRLSVQHSGIRFEISRIKIFNAQSIA